MVKVLLVAPQHNGEEGFKPGGQVTAATGLRDQLRQCGHLVDVINVVPPNYTTASSISKAMSAARRLMIARKMLRRNSYDCAILFTGSLFNLPERLLIASCARNLGVKTALFFRNSRVLGMSPGSIKGWLLARLLRIPHFLFVQGQVWVELFVSLGVPGNRVQTIPNWLPMGISIANKPKGVQPGEKVRFAFVGRLTKDKGIFELVEAVRLLANRYNFEFQVVGDGDAFEALKTSKVECDVEAIKLLGWQNQNGVFRVLENAHIFVFPSYSEGFPNAVLEAMAHGLGVIATDVGALTESVHNGVNGFSIVPKSSSELAEAMSRYLDNPSLISIHSAASLQIVHERHDRATNCQRIIDRLWGGKA